MVIAILVTWLPARGEPPLSKGNGNDGDRTVTAQHGAGAAGPSAGTQQGVAGPAAGTKPKFSLRTVLRPAAKSGPGHLAPGSHPSVLPGPILIADKFNNRLLIVDRQGRVRWRFPTKGDLRKGQSFRIPDDAFFTPDGKHIIATQEDDQVISLIDIPHHRIVWRYGVPGVPGSGRNHLDHPDDAMLLPGHTIVAGDIKNCRIIKIHYPQHHLAWSNGQPGSCYHDPPGSIWQPQRHVSDPPRPIHRHRDQRGLGRRGQPQWPGPVAYQSPRRRLPLGHQPICPR
jgi:hypothetical protein